MKNLLRRYWLHLFNLLVYCVIYSKARAYPNHFDDLRNDVLGLAFLGSTVTSLPIWVSLWRGFRTNDT